MYLVTVIDGSHECGAFHGWLYDISDTMKPILLDTHRICFKTGVSSTKGTDRHWVSTECHQATHVSASVW
jgi:hypothetical protein